jgi:hypothetical protein
MASTVWVTARAGNPLSPLPQLNLSRPIMIQRLRSRDTPLGVNFYKEPLYFSIFEPAVHKRKARIRFIRLKA